MPLKLTRRRMLAGIGKTAPVADVDQMLPPDRKAWFQSERERLKLEQETNELIPAEEVAREFSAMQRRWFRCWKHYRISWSVISSAATVCRFSCAVYYR